MTRNAMVCPTAEDRGLLPRLCSGTGTSLSSWRAPRGSGKAGKSPTQLKLRGKFLGMSVKSIQNIAKIMGKYGRYAWELHCLIFGWDEKTCCMSTHSRQTRRSDDSSEKHWDRNPCCFMDGKLIWMNHQEVDIATFWSFNIAMENDPLLDDFTCLFLPIKSGDFP